MTCCRTIILIHGYLSYKLPLMELSVFLIVLFAALLHAAWNAFVKKNDDRVLFMALLIAASSFGALVMIPFLPLPAPPSWPYIGLSVILHVGYSIFLIFAYKFGDLSHVYPLARGSAPLIVALAIGHGDRRTAKPPVFAGDCRYGLGNNELVTHARGAKSSKSPRRIFCAWHWGFYRLLHDYRWIRCTPCRKLAQLYRVDLRSGRLAPYAFFSQSKGILIHFPKFDTSLEVSIFDGVDEPCRLLGCHLGDDRRAHCPGGND